MPPTSSVPRTPSASPNVHSASGSVATAAGGPSLRAPEAEFALLAADDHPIVRLGLSALLGAEFPDATADVVASGEQVLDALSGASYDILVMDLQLHDRDGVSLIKEISRCYPKVPVVVISMQPEDPFAIMACRAGAVGYVNKSKACSCLADAIRSVLDGHIAFSPWARNVILAGTVDEPHRFHELSPRESEIVTYMVEGLPMKEIAGRLGVSPSSINTYRHRILGKIGGTTTADILRYGWGRGNSFVNDGRGNASCRISAT